jgi:phage gpG-like protein
MSIDAEHAAEHFNKVALTFMEPLTTGLERCYPVVVQSIRDNFTSSATPDGIGWPPRKIEGDGHPLLMETGALLQAATGGGPGHINEIEEGTDLVVGVTLDVVPYARAQALGYGPRNLPSRQYLGLTKAGEDQCAMILMDFAETRAFGIEAGLVEKEEPAGV